MALPSRTNRSTSNLGPTFPALLLLLFLLVIPTVALFRLTTSIDWRIIIAIPVVASLITGFAYRSDKRRAQAGEWRIPEAELHLGSLLGGWPGAFIAQRRFRHKTAKVPFQVVFWSTVLLHQYVALDWLLAWRLTTSAAALLHR